jgi:hypothetical protein
MRPDDGWSKYVLLLLIFLSTFCPLVTIQDSGDDAVRRSVMRLVWQARQAVEDQLDRLGW